MDRDDFYGYDEWKTRSPEDEYEGDDDDMGHCSECGRPARGCRCDQFREE